MPLLIEFREESAIAKRFFLTGDLDTETAPQFQECIDREVGPGILAVILDLGKLEFLSSAGVQVIFKLKKLMKKQNGELLMNNLQPHIMKVFEIIKTLDSVSL